MKKYHGFKLVAIWLLCVVVPWTLIALAARPTLIICSLIFAFSCVVLNGKQRCSEDEQE